MRILLLCLLAACGTEVVTDPVVREPAAPSVSVTVSVSPVLGGCQVEWTARSSVYMAYRVGSGPESLWVGGTLRDSVTEVWVNAIDMTFDVGWGFSAGSWSTSSTRHVAGCR